MGKRTKRPERLELRLSVDEKNLIAFAAAACGTSQNEFVVKATIKELKRLKIKPTREQGDLFKPKPGEQMNIF